ncbi:hypothetical protein TNIN_382101 [Trichonephila inaurata madagascariensis]|uniref:Uncharacterized protein n=1 Tax=Trichonephila inaurata madagascariensis TaxID=2747483 RepID=A0A8X6Y008_9ARAC|nr:hypothetical protein TNIN_382101 [Trichonephila inaurata madagascariensis]
MVYSPQIMSLHVFNTVAILDVIPMLKMGFLTIFRFNGSLIAECAVCLASSSIAPIPDTATARDISLFNGTSVSFRLSRKDFTVPLGVS